MGTLRIRIWFSVSRAELTPIPESGKSRWQMNRRALIGFISLMILILSPLFTSGRDISKSQYIQHLPLVFPKFVSQTEASRRLHLFGDTADPDYRDIHPVDGIDDKRMVVLEKIALRFAPLLIQNTSTFPMDVKYFLDRSGSFPLYIDTWDISKTNPALTKSQAIDFHKDDDELLSALKEFHPVHPTNPFLRTIVKNAGQNFFWVLYFDFPGHNERTWKEEWAQIVSGLQISGAPDPIKTYAHPFIMETATESDGSPHYEFVLQYWFFYPFNDWGNNHEGDWEHINVFVSPLNKIGQSLNQKDITNIFAGERLSSSSSEDQLVIKRIDYYFHYSVMTLDFTSPNVYLSYDQWQIEVQKKIKGKPGERGLWEKIRHMAYKDPQEREINTHPVGYIGGDNRCYNQLLVLPGQSNQDSHGTYPFSGVYQHVGPVDASEHISQRFDQRTHSEISPDNRLSLGRGNVISFENPERITIIPDWERLAELVLTDQHARQEWAWLLLPIHWGYPSSPSPFAGIVPHMDLGNLSTLGPACNEAWNRTSGGPGYSVYSPLLLTHPFALGWKSNFFSSLGFFNLIGLTLGNLPPLDLFTRSILVPLEMPGKHRLPVFSPQDSVSFRFVCLSTGAFQQNIPEELMDIAFTAVQREEILGKISETAPISEIQNLQISSNPRRTGGMFYRIGFAFGSRISSENTLRHFHTDVGMDITLPNGQDPFAVRAEMNFWEYTGSFRLNLATQSFLPFLKAGYGWSWYRLEDISAGGFELNNDRTPWIHKTTQRTFRLPLPNSWHWGVGVEYIPWSSPEGFDMGICVEYTSSAQSFSADLVSLSGNTMPQGICRVPIREIRFSLSLSY